MLNELIEKTNNSEKLKASRTEKEIWIRAAPDIYSAITGQPANETLNMSYNGKSIASIANAAALKQIALLDSQLDNTYLNYKGERLHHNIKEKLLHLNVDNV